MSENTIRALDSGLFPLAKKFYKQFGQPTKTNRNDQIYATFSSGIMLACLRIAPCGDTRLLRGVFVAPEHRGKGLARALISHALKHSKLNEIWTFPYSHLNDFYVGLNFQTVSPEIAPSPIQDAFDVYTRQGKNISLMRWQHL